MKINFEEVESRLSMFDQISNKGAFIRLDNFVSKRKNLDFSNHIFNIISPMFNYENSVSWEEIEADVFSRFPSNFNQNMNVMIEIERLFLKSNPYFLNYFTAVEYPINVRIAHSVIPLEYLLGRYPTDKLHLDRWGMEPEDIFNVLMYLKGDAYTKCEFRKVDIRDIDYFGKVDIFDEASMSDLRAKCEKLPIIKDEPELGDLYIFDSGVPHATVRSNSIGRGRLSIDFRFKFEDPYAEYEKYLVDGNPNNVRLSKYWYPISEEVSTLGERYESELYKIKSKYGKNLAYQNRQREFMQLSGEKND